MGKMGEVVDFQSRKDRGDRVKSASNPASERKFLLGKPYYIANHESGTDKYPVLEVTYSGMQYADEGIMSNDADLHLFQTAPDAYGLATMIATPDAEDVFDTKEEAIIAFDQFFDRLYQISNSSKDAFIKYSAETIFRNLTGKRVDVYLEGLKTLFPDIYKDLIQDGKLNNLNV